MIGKNWLQIQNSPELNPDWANVAKSGVIAVQDHGDDVWYRNIKILEQ